MPKKDLTGKKIAILVDEGFEQVELIKPRKALDKTGAQTQVVSPQQGEVRLLTSAATMSWQSLESALGSARLTQRQRTQTFLAVITLRSATVGKNSIPLNPVSVR